MNRRVQQDLMRIRRAIPASLRLWNYEDAQSVERELHDCYADIYGHVTEVSDVCYRVLCQGYRVADLQKVTHPGFGESLRESQLAGYRALWERIVAAAMTESVPVYALYTDAGFVVAYTHAMVVEAARQHLSTAPDWRRYEYLQHMGVVIGKRLFKI